MGNEMLLIADIGGYTRFIRAQRKSLAHAQVAVAKLLESIIGAASPFLVEKLEGDAVFLHLPWSTGAADPGLVNAVLRMRKDFISTQTMMVSSRTCGCEGCSQVKNLRLKFVAHSGEVARQKIGPYLELAGLDVILVHRMLKNQVPVSEYLLGSSTVQALMGPGVAKIDHDFEGIGPTATYFRDLSSEDPARLREPEPASCAMKVMTRMMLEAGAVRLYLGLSSPFRIKGAE
jgi:hypothetical protein